MTASAATTVAHPTPTGECPANWVTRLFVAIRTLPENERITAGLFGLWDVSP